MAVSISEIRTTLAKISDRWASYSGTERSASQTFLNALVGAYTGADDALQAGARFEEFGAKDDGSGYMDLYWPGIAIIEMKRPSETQNLVKHRAQAIEYWKNSANLETMQAAPPFLVLCSFLEFEIWKPGEFPNSPLDRFTIEELPERAESLMFLAGKTPRFGGDGPAVTKEAADLMVRLYESLITNQVHKGQAQRFVMQTLWELFAEDLGIVPGRPLEILALELSQDLSRSSSTEIFDLFSRLNTPNDAERNLGRAERLPYVNGELFSEVSRLHLNYSQLRLIHQASQFDWTKVDPTIFGTILEGCMGAELRSALGAHYTYESDILKVVMPTVIQPWIEKMNGIDNLKDGLRLYSQFLEFKVLDPAMGAGNFLAVAYRELRRLEKRFRAVLADISAGTGAQLPFDMAFYPLTNLFGIEKDSFATELSKITLWLTHALEVSKGSFAEETLPLKPLKHNLINADSLHIEWPKVDAIIGNPPYHGDRQLRGVIGDEEVVWLQRTFGIGVKDYCIYFLRRVHEHLSPGCRAGLVLTNSVASGRSAPVGLGYVLENGGVITDAISSQKWSGEAQVHVSIVNWINGKFDANPLLDGRPVKRISQKLMDEPAAPPTRALAENEGLAFIGFFPHAVAAWKVNEIERLRLLDDPDVDYSRVLSRYMTGNDLNQKPVIEPSDWLINFGRMSQEEARSFPKAFQIVEERVKPVRDKVRREAHKKYWWRWAETRPALLDAVAPLSRMAGLVLHSEWNIVVWLDKEWRPNHGVAIFAIDDDYRFGVLLSSIHRRWAVWKGSTLGSSPRYREEESFGHFPFPEPSSQLRTRISKISADLNHVRAQEMAKHGVSIQDLYGQMESGGFAELASLHQDLDVSVAEAYGWKKDVLKDRGAMIQRLVELNLQRPPA